MKRLLTAALACAAFALMLPATGGAAASITHDAGVLGFNAFADSSENDVANNAIVEQPQYMGAPAPTTAVVSAPFNGFPIDKTAIFLSSGNALALDQPSVSTDNEYQGPSHGANMEDVTTLKLGFNVRPGGDCLTFDYRLYTSESLPPSLYYEGLIAQIDQASLSREDSTTEAPGNFALAPDGSHATVVSLVSLFSELEPGISGFQRATSPLTATTTVTPGKHSLYLSVHDDGDNEVDTGAQIANIRVGTLANGACGPFVASNAFTLGKLTVNKKKGTATLATTVDSPGTITVYDAKGPAVTIAAKKKKKKKKKKVAMIVKSTVNVTTAGPVTLTIKPSKAGKKILKAKGKLRVRVAIANKPTGGVVKTQYKTITLKLKKKKKR